MLKNCSACHTKHSPPYGKYCKYTKSSEMSLPTTDPPSRDDPRYIDYLEEQLAAAKDSKSDEDTTLQAILARLNKLELSTPAPGSQYVPALSTSVPVTTSSTVTTAWSALPSTTVSTSWAAPWSAPPCHSTSGASANPWSPPVSSPWIYHSRYGHMSAPPAPPGMSGFTYPTLSQVPRAGGIPGMTTSTAPADLMASPLTSALEHLSQAIDPSVPSSTKGIQLRPEYYIQHVDQGIAIKSLDHTKLSYRELVCGMNRVLDYLVSINGDAASYLEHMIFVTKQASVHSFTDSAYVSYDRAVVDKVAKGNTKKFVAGDTLAVASHFHAGNLLPVNNPRRQFGRGRGFRGRRSGFSDTDRAGETSLPEGFPSDVCYNFNYRSCSGVNCQKQHVCRLCKGLHRAIGCQEKKDWTPTKK